MSSLIITNDKKMDCKYMLFIIFVTGCILMLDSSASARPIGLRVRIRKASCGSFLDPSCKNLNLSFHFSFMC